MVIAKIIPRKPQNDTLDHCPVEATNYIITDQNSEITMTTVSRNQMQDSTSSSWPTCRQSYIPHSNAHENDQNDWPTLIGCDSNLWSTGQILYTNQDHQKQSAQEEGNFHDYLQAKYLTSNTSYSENLRLVNTTKIDETITRQMPYRAPVDNQHANHQHNYYNPITVNHVHVNYNATDAYNTTNQHRMYHIDHACNRYQHDSIYAHDNHGCNQSGLSLGGTAPVAPGELSSTISSPSLYHTPQGHQGYSSPIRATSQSESSRISFAEPNKSLQHALIEQPCGPWISHAQYHEYTPQVGGDKLPESVSVISQANNQQARASFRVQPPYGCSDGFYEYHKADINSDNMTYAQSSTHTTTACDQAYRHSSLSSSTLPMAIDCPSRSTNEFTFVATDDSKMIQTPDKLDSCRTEPSNGSSRAYQGVLQTHTPVQQQPPIEKTQPESKTASASSAASRSQMSTDRLNQCRICGRNYARPSTLKTHLRTHTNERPYKCAVCRKTFSQAANLTAHQRVHTGERPFPCPICGRQFSQSSSVITHLRTHSGERPYRCAMCNRRFSDSSTLTKHCRIHSGEKPYQCDYCPMNFSQSGNLSRHLRLHLMGGLNKTTSTSAAVGSDSSVRHVGPDNVVEIDSGSLATASCQAAAANQRRHSTNLSNSSPESTLSPLI